MVLTQDLQVFPSLIPPLVGADPGSPPPAITESFVTTRDNVRIRVWEMNAEGKERSVALILHGNADSLPNIANLQNLLAKNGISSFSFDYRGSGASTGWPSEEGIYLDGEAVMDDLLNRKGTPPNRVGVLGISVGTGPASYLAQRYKVGKLVLVSPYFSIRDLVAEMPLYGLLVPFFKYRFPTAEYLAQATETEIAIFHGVKDTTIPFSHSERIVKHIPTTIRHELIRIDNAGHNDILSITHREIVARLY
jgi:alpha-beta hydrolase superfamily lysophospholipase